MQPGIRGPQVQEDLEQSLRISGQDPRAALEFVQRASDLDPEDPRVQEQVQRSFLERLRHDPFVAFIAETDKTYIVTFRNSRPIVVPKGREQPELFPPPLTTEGERALGMIWWIVLGLIPAGIGALILSPIVARRGMDILNQERLDRRESRLARLAIILACALGGLGAVFASLLMLHLVA